MIARTARSALAVAVALVAGLTPALAANGATHRPPAAQAPTTFKVVAHLSTHSVRAGHPATIAGSVAPARPGNKVFLQQDRLGHWTTIRVTTLNGASEYTFTVTPPGSGTKLYRVLKLREGSIRRATSPVRRLSSYRWFRLDQLLALQGTGFFFGAQTIANTLYPHAMSTDLSGLGDDELTVVELHGVCTSVKGTLGMTDDSPPGASARVTLVFDGTIVLQPAFGPGEQYIFTLKAGGVSRMQVEAENLADTDAVPSFAGGQALCAFERPPIQP